MTDNIKRNNYVISDIHGCLKTFELLLERINLTKEDNLFLLGDYIDRGPSSKQVIDVIRNLINSNYNIRCLRGNHEQMLLDEIKNDVWPPGIEETLKSFEVKHNREIPNEYVRWMKSLHYYYEFDRYIFVHAGFNFKAGHPFDDAESMLWVRDWYKKLDREWLGDRIIVHGHTPIISTEIIKMRDWLEESRVLNIDNGCVFDWEGLNSLCCFNLDTWELTFQPNVD